jgi:putative nucleotidyltransferase with HDIG domain
MTSVENNTPLYISVDQLQVGIYVYLDLDWKSHPFSFGQFRIKDEHQIDTIRSLGLKEIRINPARSTAEPLPMPSVETPPQPAVPEPQSGEMAAKQARIAKVKERRHAIQKCEKQYLNATKTINAIAENLFARPAETIAQADDLTRGLADSLLAEKEIAIHLMNDKLMGEEVYHHAFNVSVLAMLLGRESQFSVVDLVALGMGGIFHDIGKTKIPHQVLIKADNPNKAEADLLRRHCAFGIEIAQKAGISTTVINMIAQHHEAMDGSGYPTGLKGEAIDRLARVLAVVNAYDNLCNPVNLVNALTPYGALSLMFSKQRPRFDPRFLETFIRCMGVYPPGTLVLINNEIFGMVMSVNPAKPLKPGVMVYDSNVPKEEALILDLAEESDLTITQALRPAQVPAEALQYLSPRARAAYFFDSGGSGRK